VFQEFRAIDIVYLCLVKIILLLINALYAINFSYFQNEIYKIKKFKPIEMLKYKDCVSTCLIA